MVTAQKERREKGGSPRERLLAAADELFYNEGIHTVGIDRIIEKAGVAKGSLYYNFDGKDDLVRQYLLGRFAKTAERLEHAVAGTDDPRERVLRVFDSLGERMREPDFRGCAFARATAEASADGPEAEETAAARDWLHGFFTRLTVDLGAPNAPVLAEQFILLYDGARSAFQMDHDPRAADAARGVAEVLLDAATR